ncbi:DUF4198 domain-containing protein [Acinetobacter ihumii]|uniref:DUF4198 domain-containing protein n=1 Tax=Acinetobacter ihumii TaxID=2483802 RepID=UPI0010304C1D|nr:DUF4198 domain-containing protein [Acinetobacter ihumii]
MKQFKLLACLLLTTSTFAHEPYLAPLSYHTENTQVALIAGYAEEALNSEHPLKDAKITVINPQQQSSQINVSTQLKSASVADLGLPISGTYLLETKASFPLNYVKDQKQWKLLFEVPADKAGAKSQRDYLIPDDFKNKKYNVEKVTREWTLQSYVTKNKATPVSTAGTAAIQVVFDQNPTQLKANQAVKLKLTQAQQALTNAEIHLRAKGATDKQSIQFKSDQQGAATIRFPHSGEYLIEVTKSLDPAEKPQNQYYTIITVSVQPEQ